MNGHILVVEDSPTQAANLQRLLEHHSFMVTVAVNGKDGLAKALEIQPALVISDVVMPIMSGYELSRAIKQDSRLKATPVILLTALADPVDLIQGLQSGADYYVTKPYEHQYLLQRIDEILARPDQRVREDAAGILEVTLGGKHYPVESGRVQMLNLLLSTYENAIERNKALTRVQEELRALNRQLESRVEELELSRQQQRQERELSSLEELTSAPASVTAHMFGLAPLRESAPDAFATLVQDYSQLIELALEERTFRVKHDIDDRVRLLAGRMTALKAGARDVVQLHTSALRVFMQDSTPQKAQAVTEEGRLLVLQLMGNLVLTYRNLAVRGRS